MREIARRSGLPGPIVRLARDPLAVTAIAIVAVIASLTATVQETSTYSLTGLVDAHWRGAYDILVRPSGTELGLERTGGLVEPNYIGLAGGGGISIGQLAAVRQIPGVELAAPIAFVGLLRGDAPVPTIHLDTLPAKPTLYRVTLRATTGDGLSRQLVQQEVGEVLIGPASPGQDPTINWATDLGGIGGSVDPSTGQVSVDISAQDPLPGLSVPVIAVDPAAELELLGTSASFLDPLAGVSQAADRTAGAFDPSQIAPGFDQYAAELAAIQSPENRHPADRDLPVIPLVVGSRLAADLQVDLTVEQLGHPLNAYPTGSTIGGTLAAAAKGAGAGSTTIGTSSVSAGATLAPFRLATLAVAWPGSTLANAAVGFFSGSTIDARLVGRPDYLATSRSPPDPGAPAFEVEPQGLVGPDGDPTTPKRAPDAASSGLTTGAFQAYRQLVSVPLAVDASGFQPHGTVAQPFVLAPVGTFDPTAIKIPNDPLDYVPLGAYDPADTTYIADPQGRAVAPTDLQYPLNPDGLIATPPLAITDLAGATTLRGSAPIDAIRVRVAGLEGFGPDAEARVNAVATAISRLGLDVDIVAGSSPQTVDLYVPEYQVDQVPPADLGWVSQHWTTLGAAQRVVTGFTAADLAFMAATVLSALVYALALVIIRAERRRRDLAIMAAVGWSGLRMARWQVGEPLTAGALIALMAALSYTLVGRSTEALLLGLLIAGSWIVAGVVVSVASVLRTQTSGGDQGQPILGMRLVPRVNGVATYAVRDVLAHWPVAAATTLGLASAAATIVLACGAFLTTTDRIGPTRLAVAALTGLQGYQIAALALISVGALTFVVAAIRLDLQRLQGEIQVLTACGWAHADVGILLATRRAVLALGAAALAALVTGVAAEPVAGVDSGGAAACAAALAGSIVVWGGWVGGVRLRRRGQVW